MRYPIQICLRLRLAISRGFGKVQSVLTEEARDIGVAAGHGTQTNSNPTTTVQMTVSTSPASDSSTVWGDHSGDANLKKQLDICEASLHTEGKKLDTCEASLHTKVKTLDTCEASLHTKAEENSEMKKEIVLWRSKADAPFSAMSHTSDWTTSHVTPGQAETASADVAQLPERFGYYAHTMFEHQMVSNFFPYLSELKLSDDGNCSAPEGKAMSNACPLFTAFYQHVRGPPLTRAEREERASTAAGRLLEYAIGFGGYDKLKQWLDKLPQHLPRGAARSMQAPS